MASEVRSYNPAKVIVIVGGAPIKGLASDSFLTIARIADGVTSQAGADGEVARAISSDKRHRVTIVLQQTSQSNAVLAGFEAADSLSGAGLMVPVFISDLLGSGQFVAAQAWVVKKPDRGYGSGISNREWVLETGEPSIDTMAGSIA